MAAKLPRRIIAQLDEQIGKLSKGVPEERQEALTRLVGFEKSGTIPLESLIEMSDSPDSNLAIYAIMALGRNKSTEAAKKLVKLLEDNRQGNMVKIEMIVDALGAAGQKVATRPLLGLLSIDVGAKGKLLGWLGRKSGKEQTDPERVRVQDYLTLPVVRALENLMDPAAAEALAPFLDHSDPLVRWHAIQAMLKCRVTDYNGKLQQMSKEDVHDLVREAALIALSELSPLPQSQNN
ncbi:MAG: HEAT repeat domain-containing protein [SAR324 cluster bacterium]|nr:HEAT repeat domain-containing protein [SAR324 cluster bacterium]